MLNLKVDAKDLDKWSNFFSELPGFTKPAIAQSLNEFGHGIVQAIAQRIMETSGQDLDTIIQAIQVKEAEARDLVWEMDATAVIPPSAEWNHGEDWQSRSDEAFQQNTLVNIMTMEDGYDCELCQQKAEEGPYTMGDIATMQAKWAGYVPSTPNIAPGIITNLVHPRCRCIIKTAMSYRRMPVAFGGSAGVPPELLTMRGLTKVIGDNLKVQIRIVKNRNE